MESTELQMKIDLRIDRLEKNMKTTFKELENKMMTKFQEMIALLTNPRSEEEATNHHKPTRTLLEKFYSKRNKFKGKLQCPVDGCGHVIYSRKGYFEHFRRCHAAEELRWPLVLSIVLSPVQDCNEEDANPNIEEPDNKSATKAFTWELTQK